MKKISVIPLSITLFLILLSGCAGDDAVQKVYEYMDKTLSIIEAHKDNPAKAADEVNSYITGIQSQLDKAIDEFENDAEKTKRLADKLRPLFEKQERLLTNNLRLRKNIRLQQALVIFEVLAYTG
jgi:hypothetical protein